MRLQEINIKEFEVKKLSIVTALSASIMFISNVNASAEGQLFISPQRLDLTDKAAIGQLHLVNKSDDIKQYEIKLVNYAMDENGNLQAVEEMPYSADGFIRFSPRRVTLESGEDQYVRVMARMPKTLELGGYHTHIEFDEVEGAFNRKEDTKELGDNNTSFSIASTYSVAIPVFVKNGETEANADLLSVSTNIAAGSSVGEALVGMKRTGNDGSYNVVEIEYIDAAGKVHVAATPAKIPVYREADEVNRKFALSLPEGVKFNAGEIRVSLYPIDEKEKGNPIDVVSAKIN